MKPIKILILLLYSSITFSQIRPPEVYLSFSGFLEGEFESSTYFNFAVGSELFTYKFITPEADITYYFGGNNDKRFTSWVGGIGSKLFIQDNSLRFALIPKYHWGKQSSESNFQDSENILQQQKFNFLSCSLGVEFSGSERKGKTGIYLTYTGFNAGKTLNTISPTIENYKTKAIGVTIRLISGISKENNHI